MSVADKSFIVAISSLEVMVQKCNNIECTSLGFFILHTSQYYVLS